MAKRSIVVTGDAEVDANLRRMNDRAIKKLLPKAAKEAAKVTKTSYQQRVPVASGAMRDAIGTKVNRYKHKRATGKKITRGGRTFSVKKIVAEDVGARVFVDRKRLMREAGKVKRGRKSLPLDARRGGMFFYPAVVELGGHRHHGTRPLTRALYDNKGDIRREFINALRRLTSHFSK